MNKKYNYIEINRLSWNSKTDIHVKSKFYDVEAVIKGKSSLNNIELEMLGDIKGKKILHLQCHFGQDTISLTRMGAKVTGIDLSNRAILHAIQLAKKSNSDANFICCNIYDLPNHLSGEFDIVFTSYGTIGWLPDLDKWAEIVSMFLKPNGEFIFVEFHPVLWMFDGKFKKIKYNYFNSGPILETIRGTYADKSADITQKYIVWNHSLSEVINSLINNNIEINCFKEYDFSPYNCFNKVVENEAKKYRIKHFENKIPMIYSIKAIKKNNDKGIKKIKFSDIQIT